MAWLHSGVKRMAAQAHEDGARAFIPDLPAPGQAPWKAGPIIRWEKALGTVLMGAGLSPF